jgi:hypothetical protein
MLELATILPQTAKGALQRRTIEEWIAALEKQRAWNPGWQMSLLRTSETCSTF